MTVATRPLLTGSVPARPPGTWTPDGSPATIDSGSGYKAFPSVARLGLGRLLLTYYHGSAHLGPDGVIKGRIGTLTGYSVTWGSAFTIHDDALDVRCDDGLSVIDGRVVVTGRYYDGSHSFDPFVMVCDDRAAVMTAASTWTEHPIALAEGDDHNIPARIIKVGSSYVMGVYHDVAGTYPGAAGVLLNDSLTDWSAPTYVAITGTGYTELSITRLWGSTLLALLRKEADQSTAKALSTDGGLTWGAVSAAHDSYGLPAARRLTDGTILLIGRDAPVGDNVWRTSPDAGATWSAETVLDATGVEGMYGSLVQLDHEHTLAVYSVEMSASDADLYSQLFTRA